MHIRRLIQTLRADLRLDTTRGSLIRSAGVTAGLNIGATVIAFLASLLYARALGPHDYGLYAYVIAWATLLAIPVSLGFPGYFVREGAKTPFSTGWLRRWADKRILIAGLSAAILMASAWYIPQAAGSRWLFVAAALLPLINALGSIRSALLQSQGQVVRSLWATQIAGPTLMLVVLGALWIWRGRLHPVELIFAMMGASLLQLFINSWQLHQTSPRPKFKPVEGMRLRAALPFMWLGGLYLINNRTDLIMLGSLRGAHDAGVYAVASRIAALVTFFAVAANANLAPKIAQLYHNGEHVLLQRMLRGAGQRIVAVTAPFT
ncbi:MAG: oligosaccharide flippase family protein, partial [Candidatus Micrarchaeaceae archaeon]